MGKNNPMDSVIANQIAAEKKVQQLERKKEKVKAQNSKRERSKRTHHLILVLVSLEV